MTSDAASTMKVRFSPLPVSTGFCEAGFMILGWIEWPICFGTFIAAGDHLDDACNGKDIADKKIVGREPPCVKVIHGISTGKPYICRHEGLVFGVCACQKNRYRISRPPSMQTGTRAS
jgi:hypothetical protein